MVRIHSDGLYVRPTPGEIPGARSLLLDSMSRPTSLDESFEHARRVLAFVESASSSYATRWLCLSGGNDSVALLYALVNDIKWQVDGVVHVNTRTGVPETSQFARKVTESLGLPFVEAFPPKSYEQVFIHEQIIGGLPGPGMHMIAFGILKERAFRWLVREIKQTRRENVILITGVREDESQNRMATYGGKVCHREGSRLWVSPVFYLTKERLMLYRRLNDIPRNPVSDNLHMSGECLCGSFAVEGELEQLKFFYPEVEERIRGWEHDAFHAGCKYWKWGQRRSNKVEEMPLLCQGCSSRGV